MKKQLLSGCLVLISIVMVVLLSACGHGSADSGYDAHANLTKGDVYNAHFVTITDTTMTVDGTEHKSSDVSDMNMSLTVQNIDQDHNAMIQCKFTALKSSQTQAGGSSQDFSPLVNQLFAGKGFSAKVSPRGEVLEITGLDSMVDQAVASMPIGSAEKQVIKEVLQQGFSADNMKVAFASLGGHFPKKSVQVGDTWDDTRNMKMFVPITLKGNWKFVSDKDGILSVEGKGKISVPEGQTGTSIRGIAAKMDLAGDFEETLQMHKDQMFVQTGTWTEHEKGTMEFDTEGQTTKMPIAIESKKTCEITKQ